VELIHVLIFEQNMTPAENLHEVINILRKSLVRR